MSTTKTAAKATMTISKGTTKGAALITGASSGIGRELAQLMAMQDYPLVLVGRNQERLDEVAEQLRTAFDARVWTFAVDLGHVGAARAVFEYTESEGLQIEYLVNNAGVGVYGDHSEIVPERIDAMLQLNVTALVDLCHLYGAQMRARKSGRILNVASTAAYQPTPFFAAYGASKAFVLNFSEALAMELSDHGVTVSCLSPGPTDTAFFGEMDTKGLSNPHFAKTDRDSAQTVAQIGFETMMAGDLSRIVGVKNYLRAWSGRLVPRSTVAKFAKGLMVTERQSS